MTSGGSLPFRTFTENGIQSISSALEPNGDENVVSEFLSKPDRTFLNGCNDVILPRQIPLVDGTAAAQVQTFVIPNGCDAITDIYLNLALSKSTNADSTNNAGMFLARKSAFLGTIDKVEFRVGNQIWQTMTSADLLIRNLTEHHQGFNDFNSSLISFTGDMVGTNVIATGGDLNNFLFTASNYKFDILNTMIQTPTNYKVLSSINLMSFSSGGSKLNSFLQYGARNNNIEIKIYYNELYFEGDSFKRILFGGSLNENILQTELIIKRHLFTDSEKRYIENNIVNSVIKTSQSMIKYVDPNNVIDNYTTIINLDDTKDYEQTFSINCSHICFTIERNILDGTNDNTVHPTSVMEWYDLSQTISNSSIFYSTNDKTVPFQIFDCIKYAELIVDGASVTGKLPASYLKNCAKDLQLNVINSYPVYTIPLASTKFGNDSILLSKLSNKSLVLTFDKNQILDGKTLVEAASTANPCRVNITAIGTNVVTYVGGECSQQITFNRSYIQPLPA